MSNNGITGGSPFIDFNNIKLNAEKNGKLSSKEIKQISDAVLNDENTPGIVDKNEMKGIMEIIKDINSTVALDSSESEPKLVDFEGISKTFEKALVQAQDGVVSALESAAEILGSDEGKNEIKKLSNDMTEKAVKSKHLEKGSPSTYDDALAATLADESSFIGKFTSDTMLGRVAKSYLKGEQNIDQKAKETVENNAKSTAYSEIISDVVKHTKDFAFDAVNCVHLALKSVENSHEGQGSVELTDSWLTKTSGKKWDAVSGDSLKNGDYLKGQEGKALISDSGHVYVFDKVLDNGLIQVTDPSEKGRVTELNPKNPTLTAFVHGKGDGDKTEEAESTKFTRSFSDMANPKSKMNEMNPIDSKNSESFEIRKTFALFADPKKRGTVKNLATAMNNRDVSSVQKILAKNGVKLDSDEIKAMITVMTRTIESDPGTEVRGEVPSLKGKTMLDGLVDLSKQRSPQLFSPDQNRFLNAIQYTNVDFADYFSSTVDVDKKEADMSTTFYNILNGRDGC